MNTSQIPATAPAPSGTQYRLSAGTHRATITEVGAMVREYSVDGRDVFVPFDEHEPAPVFNAAVLVPWPNRLRDGRYTTDDGETHQLPLSEPDRGTALHGLGCWYRWSAVEVADHAVTLELALPAQKGWPFQLTTRVRYALDAEQGLEVRVTTRNVGTGTAPYGVGFHPWLSAGGADLDDCTVRLDATEHVTVDDRLLPTGVEPVAGDHDLRTTRSLAGLDLDDAWVGATRDERGLSWCRLGCPDGRTAAVWADSSMDCWQVCSANHITGHERLGLAAEPMSCYADAFNTGDRLVRLAPGEEHEVRWGATLL
ncbi:aldose 1-epimerase family protein [Isoptericola sp. b408]|uniref:aldose 1-epimerase family protein n=1 Tax=Isoptericola sp. b408 TaxID=3064653 RepID=UPI0027125275|nr:aldose 1-epimerase family protein [Isoptericola sp. b408]MDO8151521.1 aldose 1-epimerase family protein [Isoptericola sp. b408]